MLVVCITDCAHFSTQVNCNLYSASNHYLNSLDLKFLFNYAKKGYKQLAKPDLASKGLTRKQTIPFPELQHSENSSYEF